MNAEASSSTNPRKSKNKSSAGHIPDTTASVDGIGEEVNKNKRHRKDKRGWDRFVLGLEYCGREEADAP